MSKFMTMTQSRFDLAIEVKLFTLSWHFSRLSATTQCCSIAATVIVTTTNLPPAKRVSE